MYAYTYTYVNHLHLKKSYSFSEKSVINATLPYKKSFKCNILVHKYITKNVLNKLNHFLCIQ